MIYLCLTNIEKMDCRILRQSEAFIFNGKNEDIVINGDNKTVIPKNIVDYIDNTSNQKQKHARLCAYTSLFFSLKEIFDEDRCTLEFNGNGKPYILGAKRNLYVNISHSDTLSAVCISDEGEVGVDVQERIDDARSARLEKRFFGGLEIKSDISKDEISLTVFEETNEKFVLTKNTKNRFEIIENKNDYTEKWSLGESLLKCDGIGFGGAENVKEMQNSYSSLTTRISTENKEIALSITIKRL